MISDYVLDRSRRKRSVRESEAAPEGELTAKQPLTVLPDLPEHQRRFQTAQIIRLLILRLSLGRAG